MGWINVSFLYMAFVHQMLTDTNMFVHSQLNSCINIFQPKAIYHILLEGQQRFKIFCFRNVTTLNIFSIMHRIQCPFFKSCPQSQDLTRIIREKCVFHILSYIVLILQYATVYFVHVCCCWNLCRQSMLLTN